MSDRFLGAGVATVTVAVFAFLLWLLYGREVEPAGGTASVLPVLNAAANLACSGFLVAGYRSIRAGRRNRHIAFMLAALACSAVFLVGYVVHHQTSGDTPFRGEGIVRPIYFTILVSHVAATAVALPMILYTLAHAARGRFVDHKRIARRTLPLWLYVSVTGVLIFLFLRAWS